MLKDSDLMVASYLSPSLTKTLEEGMRAGLPVLVEVSNVELRLSSTRCMHVCQQHTVLSISKRYYALRP